MKSARFYGQKDIRVEELPDPTPEQGEVVVRVKATGICGSDLHGYRAKVKREHPPITGGHEMAGEVTAIGTEVTAYRVGDRVAIEPLMPCRKCAHCLQGQYQRCRQLKHIGGPDRAGGFAELINVPEHNIHLLPDCVSYECGAMAEVYAVAVHALNRLPL